MRKYIPIFLDTGLKVEIACVWVGDDLIHGIRINEFPMQSLFSFQLTLAWHENWAIQCHP